MPFNTFYGVSNERAIDCKASNVRFLKTSSVLNAFHVFIKLIALGINKHFDVSSIIMIIHKASENYQVT